MLGAGGWAKVIVMRMRDKKSREMGSAMVKWKWVESRCCGHVI